MVVYLLQKKSEIEIKIKEYVEMVKNKFFKRPKVIIGSRRRIHQYKEVTAYLKNQGIQIQ